MIKTIVAREQLGSRGLNALIAFFVAISYLVSHVTSVTVQQDVNALRALQSAWGGKPSSWDFSTDPCETLWLGAGCEGTQMRVTQLLLINQDLTGTLSSSIGDLTNLTNLDLSSNSRLGGSLPAEITSLKSLQRLFIQNCNFSGQIPSDIGNLTSLTYFNQLTGPLPDSTTSLSGRGLDNLTNARHFHLEDNLFSGGIPASMLNTQMQLIHL
ncbi:hypothetical protein L7F22_027999 [Adiantum nelumboides]|nr:hypothetical protein [Adiantum nelumboides]